jgi:hypothetical protein
MTFHNRCTHFLPEDLEDLVNLRIAREQWLLGDHFGEDASHRPHVDTGGVLATSQENLGSSVPERDDLCSCQLGSSLQGYTPTSWV